MQLTAQFIKILIAHRIPLFVYNYIITPPPPTAPYYYITNLRLLALAVIAAPVYEKKRGTKNPHVI